MLFVVAMLVAVASAEVSQCQGCHQDSLNEDLTKARIEWVKMQILLKLRLDQPPHVNGVRELPAPLRFENSMLLDTHTTPTPESTEDFYGKTEKVIFFPQGELLRAADNTALRLVWWNHEPGFDVIPFIFH